MEWASDLGEKGTREGLGFLGSECLTRSTSPLAGTDTDALRASGLASLPSVGRVPGPGMWLCLLMGLNWLLL